MKMKLLSNIVGIITIGLFTASTVVAHEHRHIEGTGCDAEFGWQTEPTYEDVENGIVLSLEECEAAAADIQITVEALHLTTDDYNAPVKHPVSKNRKVIGMLNAEDNFGSLQITPSKAGAYGFILTGTINGVAVNEKFVCGGGSLDTDHGSYFDCVVKPTVFPGPAINRYIPN